MIINCNKIQRDVKFTENCNNLLICSLFVSLLVNLKQKKIIKLEKIMYKIKFQFNCFNDLICNGKLLLVKIRVEFNAWFGSNGTT